MQDLGRNWWFFFLQWPWNLRDDLENNRVPLLCYFKLWASFCSHLWIQTGVTVLKRPVWVKISIFLSLMTLKFDRWPCKIIGLVFYAALSFVHYFIAVGQFKLKLNSVNAQIGLKSNFFVPCDLEIWRMTFKNNSTPFLCYFKLCESFHRHLWIQTGVTDRKCQIRAKISNSLSCVTLKFDGWSWKTIGHLFYTSSSVMHHFIAIWEFKLELWSGNTQIRAQIVLTSVTLTFDLWPWSFASTSLLSKVINFQNFIMIWWWEHSVKGVTDRQIDRWTDGLNHS